MASSRRLFLQTLQSAMHANMQHTSSTAMNQNEIQINSQSELLPQNSQYKNPPTNDIMQMNTSLELQPQNGQYKVPAVPNDNYLVDTEYSSSINIQDSSHDSTHTEILIEIKSNESIQSKQDFGIKIHDNESCSVRPGYYNVSDVTGLLSDANDEGTFLQQGITAEASLVEIQDIEIQKETATTSGGKKRKLREINLNKYTEFLSDDEDFDFVESPSSWEGTSESASENENESPRKSKRIEAPSDDLKKTKKKKRLNKGKQRKTLRNTGKKYVTKKGVEIRAREMRANPCVQKNCKHGCGTITDERRQNIFDHFWTLDTDRRRDWLVSNSKQECVKRKRTKDVSRRNATFKYFINEGEGRRQVCLTFILNTLDITQKFLHYTLSHASYGTAQEDLRGKHVPPNKTSKDLIDSVKKYIENLPSVPSHYCRKNSSKFYLPQEFKNLTNLYRLYKQNYQTEGKDVVGEKVFKNIFLKEFNIGFHVPRKDKCVKCIKYQNDGDDALAEEKNTHLKDKEETLARFKTHQEIHTKDKTILCTSFDLQKVLNTPFGESMLLYYSRKLAVYNLTFYECGSREGYCFTWDESEGKRGSNEIATILKKYIDIVDERGTIKHLILYSDSCPGQNKNKIILSCLHQCLHSCINVMSIQINYLLPGHTYMPVDSMHAVIERSVTNNIIWAPSQWATIFSLARKSPKPYHVEVLTHTDFCGWDTAAEKYFKGNLTGKISKVRTVTFKKSKPFKVSVKYSMNSEAETEEIEVIKSREQELQKIYKAALPISKKKYNDLNKLCTNKTIPPRFLKEYANLSVANNIRDTLNETDIEDEDVE